MKTLHLSIITIVGIVVILLTSLGIFIEKLNDNPEHLYTGIAIMGVKENYTLNEPIVFSVIIEGYGSGCGDTKVIITKENDSQYESPGWNSLAQCVSNTKQNYFKLNAISGNTTLNKAGNYTLTASFDDLITYRHTQEEKKFSVILPTNTSTYNARITPLSVNVTDTNFKIDYNITGNGKILDAKMDTQSKSLILSLETTSNGTLTVSIPRGLLDIKNNVRGMGEFYMLADGQETIFKEIHTTPSDRIFSIPFQNGTKNVEIIAVELI